MASIYGLLSANDVTRYLNINIKIDVIQAAARKRLSRPCFDPVSSIRLSKVTAIPECG